MRSFSLLALALTTLLALPACSDPSGPSSRRRVEVVSGDAQRALAGSTLPLPLTVRVVDGGGNPVAGQQVTFAVASGGGQLSAATDTTDAEGRASTTWTLGVAPGQQTVTAAAGGDTATFTATSVYAVSMAAVSPVALTGAPFQPLADSVAVRLTDSGGIPVPGVRVNWSLVDVSEVGSVSPAASLTGPDGVARTRVIVGRTQSTLTARTDCCQVVFSISPAAGAPAYVSISPGDVTLVQGTQQQLTTTVSDAYFHAVTTATIAWTSRNPGVATVSPAGVVNAVAPGTAVIVAAAGPGGTGPADSVTVTVASPVRYRAVAAGYNYTCGITTTDRTLCWGYGGYGQFAGPGGSAISATPAPVRGSVAFAQVDLGYDFMCGVTAAGAGYCWGASAYGQIGSPGAFSDTPLPVSGGHTWRTIQAGVNYACGLDTAGQVWCWGKAPGWSSGTSTPTLLPADSAFTRLDAGNHHACTLTASGQAFCWGLNPDGELGAPAPAGCPPVTLSCAPTPQAVATGQRFTDLATGDAVTCAVTTGGTPVCWGAVSVPGAISGSYRQISAGGQTVCAVSTAGPASCWGLPLAGNPAGPVPGGLAWSSVSVGNSHACGLATDGIAYCWGGADNTGNYRVLGVESPGISPTPVRVFGQ